MINSYVGITDRDWFETLKAIPEIDEVNFWKPGGSTNFRALKFGELFLFKLFPIFINQLLFLKRKAR